MKGWHHTIYFYATVFLNTPSVLFSVGCQYRVHVCMYKKVQTTETALLLYYEYDTYHVYGTATNYSSRNMYDSTVVNK